MTSRKPPPSFDVVRTARRPMRGSAFPIAAVLALLALVAFPIRGSLHLAIAGSTPSTTGFATLIGLVAELGLLLLVVMAGAVAVWSWLRDREAFWRLASAGVGVVGAYLTSEVVKHLVSQQRPCRVSDVTTVVTCPPVGDWSWPSNHSVIAAAFATACIVSAPRTAWIAVPVALLVAFSRVVAGVHYMHDVASGLALGTAIVAVVVVVLRPLPSHLP